jgi:hypothetical protein
LRVLDPLRRLFDRALTRRPATLLVEDRFRGVSIRGGSSMPDILYLGLIVGFLALSWGLVELCDRL